MHAIYIFVCAYMYIYMYAGFSLHLKAEQISERYHQPIRIKGEFRENA